jgi:hypothetical protein
LAWAWLDLGILVSANPIILDRAVPVYFKSCQSAKIVLHLFALCGFSYHRPARVFKSRREADVAAFEELLEKN